MCDKETVGKYGFPYPGREIYVDGGDFDGIYWEGGKDIVDSLRIEEHGSNRCYKVITQKLRASVWCWDYLGRLQRRLKREYGKKMAHYL